MRRLPSLASEARSSAGWYGRIRWAFLEMKRLPSSTMPRWTSDSIYWISGAGAVRAQVPGRVTGPDQDEDQARPRRARVPDRLLEPAGDDVAGDGGAEVTEPPREREGGRLLRGEVDDEELGSGERHRDALR